MIKTRQDRGIILLMVLGVLALMSVLAITFVNMSRLERSISRNYVDHTHALLATESGIEYALARLSRLGGSASDPALQELEWNSTKASFPTVADPLISGIMGDTYLAGGDRFRLRVSDESGKINLNDTDSQWNLDTDPKPDNPGADPDLLTAPGRLRMLVKTLGDILFGFGVGLDISNTLFDARDILPGGRFSSMKQVQDLLQDPLSPILTDDEFTKLQKHITLWTWQDKSVLRPNFKLSISEHDPDFVYPDKGFDVYVYSDFQNKSFELEARSPVNLNTASVEVLQALVQDVRGWFLREGPGERISNGRYATYIRAPLLFNYTDETTSGGSSNVLYSTPFGKNNIIGKAVETPVIGDPETFAILLWDRIHATDTDGDGFPLPAAIADPIETWEEFEHILRHEIAPEVYTPVYGYGDMFNDVAEGRGFHQGIVSNAYGGPAIAASFGAQAGMTSDLFNWNQSEWNGNEQYKTLAPKADIDWWEGYVRDAQIDAILANFNPNAQLNDYTPNRTTFRKVDKAQLTQFSTELCFSPTGMFLVDSLGIVLNSSGQQTATYRIQAGFHLFEPLRLTTQADFMGTVNNVASQDQVFQESPGIPTAGTDSNQGINGFTLQSYPEPIVKSRDAKFSIYDGNIQLSTYEEDISNGSIWMHHFNGSLDPVAGVSGYYTDGNATDLPNKRNFPSDDILTHSNATSAIPGSLYPDGVYSEVGRTISTRLENIGQQAMVRGLIGFWIKPNFTPEISRLHQFTSLFKRDKGIVESFSPNPISDSLHMAEFSLYYFPHAVDAVPDLSAPSTSTAWGWQTGWNDLNNGLTHFSWIPTRSFGFGHGGLLETSPFPGEHQVWGVQSTTASHNGPSTPYGDWPPATNHDGSPLPGLTPFPNYNFAGYAWNYVAISWGLNEMGSYPGAFGAMFGQQTVYPDPLEKTFISINGEGVTDVMSGGASHGFTNLNLFLEAHKGEFTYNFFNPGASQIPEAYTGINQYLRLGEVASDTAEFGRYSCYSADAVFDELISTPHLGNYTALNGYIRDGFELGRYYNEDTDVCYYTSPPIDVAQRLGVLPGDSPKLLSIAWTVHWPKYNRSDISNNIKANVTGVNVNDNATDPMDAYWNGGNANGLGWDPISVDISVGPTSSTPTWAFLDSLGSLSAAKESMPAQATGTSWPETLQAAGLSMGQSISLTQNDRLRFRIYFNYEENGHGLYESPVFDDITFMFAFTKPKVLFWDTLLTN